MSLDTKKLNQGNGQSIVTLDALGCGVRVHFCDKMQVSSWPFQMSKHAFGNFSNFHTSRRQDAILAGSKAEATS